MAKNWNTILRWVHLIFGFVSQYTLVQSPSRGIPIIGTDNHGSQWPWEPLFLVSFSGRASSSGNYLESRSGIVTERNPK